MKQLLNVFVTVCWLPSLWLPVAIVQGQAVSGYELTGARVRLRCCEPPRWIIGNVTALSDTALRIEGQSEYRVLSHFDVFELERSLGKPRAVIAWAAAAGAVLGYAVGTQLGGDDRSDLSGALGRGAGGLLGLPIGAAAGAIMGLVFRREDWMPVIDPWKLRRQRPD